jgi:hypothetical protein
MKFGELVGPIEMSEKYQIIDHFCMCVCAWIRNSEQYLYPAVIILSIQRQK